MGYAGPEQRQIIQVVKEASKWWIPLAVAGIGLIGVIIKAILTRKGKKNE